ncbi:hypothetical protein Syun_017081 [Stephania yunnanensis]|uniref:Uncharacterized protein n=1 Tax=Stephania yunnanensis TaxID=152371 RepID=A0AAP0J6E4_9MAGN
MMFISELLEKRSVQQVLAYKIQPLRSLSYIDLNEIISFFSRLACTNLENDLKDMTIRHTSIKKYNIPQLRASESKYELLELQPEQWSGLTGIEA